MLKAKDKERILKVAREKQLAKYKGIPIRWSIDFSAKTLKARRERHDQHDEKADYRMGDNICKPHIW